MGKVFALQVAKIFSAHFKSGGVKDTARCNSL